MSDRKIVVLGMLAKMPVPGVVWQTLHYLEGLRRLGFDPWYVEAHGRTPTMLMERADQDPSLLAAGVIDQALRPFGFGDRWAYDGVHDARTFGLTREELNRLYRDAELIINLHGGTEPRPELAEGGKLVYLETDPVQLQVELHDGVESTFAFLEPHVAFFTFAENLGAPDCGLPPCDRFAFLPTRQPVVTDLWAGRGRLRTDAFRTVANWRQPWRDVRLGDETYSWSKDREWAAFMDLPERTRQRFELALSGFGPHHQARLEHRGWNVQPALALSLDGYRDFITAARGEFTVAKDQNVRLRTGWFSDRSATFLAAGRPVVTQDTAFGCALPTGDGLFAVGDAEEAAAAIEEIAANGSQHERAAEAIGREFFEAERVLSQLLGDVGIQIGGRKTMPGKPRKPLSTSSKVLAVIPHFKCEEWLDDCLQALLEQTRPLDGIVVIDDASEVPPVDIVERYPEVTLLHSDENVGPYRLVQQVIESTTYDAILFQDADDYSTSERVEKLLEHAERTGAELIGTQEVRVFCEEPEVLPIAWPLDPDAVFAERPTAFPLLHPTSMVSRELVVQLGFSTGLKFGGDAEFLRRARLVAGLGNVPEFGYVRRIREGSLTTAPATAIGTPARIRVMEQTFEKANRNAELVARGEEPDLSPIAVAPPIELRHLAGPVLEGSGVASWAPAGGPGPDAPRPKPGARRPVDGPARPIFVVGADHSGTSILAEALGHHPAIGAPAGEVTAAGAGRWVDGSHEHARNVAMLARLFPEAKFVHVVREVDAVVRNMVDPPLGARGATGGTQIPERLKSGVKVEEALDRWEDTVRSCKRAAEQLGADRVLTVPYEDLMAAPEALVRRCLAFAGEDYAPQCMRPLRDLRPRPAAEGERPEGARWTRLRALSDELLELAKGAPARKPASASSHRDQLRALSRDRSRDVLTTHVPAGEPVLVVSRGDSELVEVDGREAWHFPQTDDGVWAGYHPRDGASALQHLDDLVRRGARHFFIPCTSLWWLDHYPELREGLENDHTEVLRDPAAGALYALTPVPRRDMRVVLVTDHFPKFSETFFVDQYLGLLERGVDVHVVSNRSNKEHWPFFPGLREQVEGRLHVARDFEAKLRELDPDVVHFGYGTVARGRMHVGSLAGAKTVVSFRGYDANHFGIEDPRCYDDVWAAADAVHLVSEGVWERVRQRGCPADKHHVVITDAVDVARFHPPQRDEDVAGTPDRPLRVLSVGRLHWKKGHQHGLAAIKQLIDREVHVEYRLIGDGEQRDETEFAVRDLGLGDHVTLEGAKSADEVRDSLAWADVLLHPSVCEAFGVAVIEAQAMGLPVVCSDAGGLPENVAEGETGFIVPRRNASGLSDRLGRLARDGALRARMGRDARLRAERHLDAARQLDRFVELYETLLGTDDPRAAERKATLDALRDELGGIEARAAKLREQVRGREVVERVHAYVAGAVPAGATVAVVTRGDAELVDLPGRRGRHFPCTPDGDWAGHHPADSEAAIAHLEDLRAQGADLFVLPATSAWWLDHYADFAAHLEEHYTQVAGIDRGFVGYALNDRAAAAAAAKAPAEEARACA